MKLLKVGCLAVLVAVGLLTGLVALIAGARAVAPRPAERAYPYRARTYGSPSGLFRGADTAAACPKLMALAGGVNTRRSVRRVQDAARRTLASEASPCEDVVMDLDGDTEVSVLERRDGVYRVVVQTPRGAQPGWVVHVTE